MTTLRADAWRAVVVTATRTALAAMAAGCSEPPTSPAQTTPSASAAGVPAPTAPGAPSAPPVPAASGALPDLDYRPRRDCDTSGIINAYATVPRWKPDAPLSQVAECWDGLGERIRSSTEPFITSKYRPTDETVTAHLVRAAMWHYDAEPWKAYEALAAARAVVASDPKLAAKHLFTVVWYQGVSALRAGETDNCVLCRGASSCILPIDPAARHANERGSRTAIRHFSEYLDRFPDDLGAKWLLNLAHMTLGEHPDKVDPSRRLGLDSFTSAEHGIGRFRDVGHAVGVDRLNQAGGAVMDDFDGDGLLDLVVTDQNAEVPMAYFGNRGDGTFEERGAAAGLLGQLGGLYCVQADYDNDGDLDLFVPRAAWYRMPVRPSLLANDGKGRFTDVTEAAGLAEPGTSITAAWGDYDNDGLVDLLMCCELQPNRLYHNEGGGRFLDVAWKAGLLSAGPVCKGATWLDFDNDGFLDVFLTSFTGSASLFRNLGDGTFANVTRAAGIDGPTTGFACWSFDYDNDGWLDVFANCYDRTLDDAVAGLVGRPHRRASSRLWHNRQGRGFEDATASAGLDLVFVTMGCNFADFDNDGFLDFYLGTGDPELSTLVPNRMFRNLGGARFVDISASSGTAHLQKGHAVACGDWDRDGDVDLFAQLGGAPPGDRFHDALFQNPGQGGHWLRLKLTGRKSNRSAIGARIRVVTAGDAPRAIERVVTSGASFGANPLEQTIGLGAATRAALVEIRWPASGTTQTFRDVAADQALAIEEFAATFEVLPQKPLPQPK